MSYDKLLIVFLTILIIFSINIVSATNITEDTTLLSDNSENNVVNSIDLDLSSEISADNSISDDSHSSLLSENEYGIYVNQNNTENGNGSKENPFKNFDLACEDVANGKENVVIYVFNGTYELSSHLKFNTTNLHIIGVEDNIVIKNKYPYSSSTYHQQAFGLIPSSGNFTVSNIIFEGSSWNPTSLPNDNNFYNIFKAVGDVGNYIVTVDNCSIVQVSCFIPNGNRNSLPRPQFIFNSCKISSDITGFKWGKNSANNIFFKNCIFNLTNVNIIGYNVPPTINNTIEDCWFGKNAIPNYFIFEGELLEINFKSFAEFKISENYLGNNTYEIIGNLFRNGTSEIITGINPMEVTLSSEDNGLNQTKAILKNGTFKVLYTSTSANHKITATLDKEVQSLVFNSVNISLDSPIITYGAKQNITVTLPSEYNGIIYVTVNGKTYNKTVNVPDLVTTIDITDILPVGSHPVNVTFCDKEDDVNCHIYGFNTTTITVSKVPEYDFDATITPNNVCIGDNATVTLKLPEGAAGNVTVKVGENEAKIFNVNDVININGFVVGNNTVNITFISDIYDTKSIIKYVFASTKPTTITAVNVTTTYNDAKDLIITLTDVNGEVLVNKTINVVVGNINQNLTTNASGQVSLNIATLTPDTYEANITFAGDDAHAKSNATAKVIVNKVASAISAPAVTATYNVAKNLVITLTVNGKPLNGQKVTVKVGTISKTLTTDAKGQVSVDVSKLTPKTYAATFTYTGDSINAESKNTAKVVVNKAKPKLTAKKATFKAKKKTKKYSIVLKDNKGKAIKKAKVTLKVKGKTYKATTNTKGKATFKITKLTKKGKATATIKFGGNTLYKAVTKKVKLTVKK